MGKRRALLVRNKDYITLLTQLNCRTKDVGLTLTQYGLPNARQKKLNRNQKVVSIGTKFEISNNSIFLKKKNKDN